VELEPVAEPAFQCGTHEVRGAAAAEVAPSAAARGDGGRRFVVGQHGVVDTENRRREGQSVVAFRAGEQLGEREALMAILLASAA